MWTRTSFGYAAIVAIALGAGGASAEEKAPAAAPQPAPSAKTTAKALCDDGWDGGFWTIGLDRVKYDGNPSGLKPYDPRQPDVPWVVPEGRYLSLGYFSDPARRNQGLPAQQVVKVLGQFYEKKEAEAFLKKLYAESRYARHINPRFPPATISPGALLVSEKYTCTLDKENGTLTKADWIVEVEGRLFAGGRSVCKQGKMKKMVSIVACDGKKVLATDAWAAPCDGSRVQTCVFRMSPGVVGIRQDYSASGEGQQSSFRAYEVERGKALVKLTGGGDWEVGGGSFRNFEDKDGDGVPEVIDEECDSAQNCKEVRVRKWKTNRFEDVKVK